MVSKFSIPTNEKSGLVFVMVLLIMDWIIRKNERLSFPINWLDYIILPVLGFVIIEYYNFSSYAQFIYFQF